MQLKVRSTLYLEAHLTNDSAALQLKARGRATLNSTGNELSAFCFTILESQAPSKRLSSFALAVIFEGVFQADFE